MSLFASIFCMGSPSAPPAEEKAAPAPDTATESVKDDKLMQVRSSGSEPEVTAPPEKKEEESISTEEKAPEPKKEEEPTPDETVVLVAPYEIPDDVEEGKLEELQGVTHEQEEQTKLMTEIVRKDMQISSLEAALAAQQRNPKVEVEFLEKKILEIRANIDQKERDMDVKLLAMQDKINERDLQIKERDETAKNVAAEHKKAMLALKLVHERKEQEWMSHVEILNHKNETTTETLNNKLKTMESQKDKIIAALEASKEQILDNLTEKISELVSADDRIRQLEEELKAKTKVAMPTKSTTESSSKPAEGVNDATEESKDDAEDASDDATREDTEEDDEETKARKIRLQAELDRKKRLEDARRELKLQAQRLGTMPASPSKSRVDEILRSVREKTSASSSGKVFTFEETPAVESAE